ncbi:hypothetical protein [Saccharolobus islandicus]|uniref:Uncharacterized protein n=1 Tax=Saccharolobus islandicus (strain M.16.4 / Kamchatka \|nr:hypothetical protein [Sulfolobus islandicus]ACR40776.1 hypothetical protein M164_0142 [Sulfolobus islandicus M.16.4]
MWFRKKPKVEEHLTKFLNEHPGKMVIGDGLYLVGIAAYEYGIPGIKYRLIVDIPQEVWRRLLEYLNVTGDPEVLFIEKNKVLPLTREEAKKLLLSERK